MDIRVCVGSSCHLKGSYMIIKRLQELIKENGLEKEVTLKGAFCMGKCVDGIPIEIGDELVLQASIINIDEIFAEHVLHKED